MIQACLQRLRQLLILLLLLTAGTVRAQIAPDSARLLIKLGLSPLVVSTYEAELEYRWLQRLSLTLTPQVVAGIVPTLVSKTANTNNDKVHGFGLRLGSRLYLPNTGTEGAALAGLYFGLQAEYGHLALSYQQEGWGEDLAADGLRYYVFRQRDYTETINRYGGAGAVGYQCQLSHPRIRLDSALIIHVLHSQSSADGASRYLSSSSDYGYSGSSWGLALNLGYVLK